jgi:hypothetical protein
MIQVELDTSWPQVPASYVEIDTGMIQVELDTSRPQVRASYVEIDTGMIQVQLDTSCPQVRASYIGRIRHPRKLGISWPKVLALQVQVELETYSRITYKYDTTGTYLNNF